MKNADTTRTGTLKFSLDAYLGGRCPWRRSPRRPLVRTANKRQGTAAIQSPARGTTKYDGIEASGGPVFGARSHPRPGSGNP